MNITVSENTRRAIAIWLLVVCALVFAMVVLGGVTRLTRSGLSIVEWQPLMGAIPPLTEAQWLVLFEKYKLTPEYQKVNVGMDLAGFQGIFWLEYFHRLLGRLIGLAFALPFVYFLVRKQIERTLAPRLWLLFALGAAQGLLGWLMVASGLVDVPRVSPYRLTAHLGLAILIYAAMLWVALGLLTPKPQAAESPTGNVIGGTSGTRVRGPRATTAWMQEVEQRREQLPRDGLLAVLARHVGLKADLHDEQAMFRQL